ncbi:DUF4254 domain-containing protein [Nocardia sp. CNY236]|uniref:DUF4254 domain-containing protein n=1 Tax=Nocardia sp. CNY236 TaxID=1169152 RepID=UPI000417872D|nr:DUF4254 domain-containing protein [Nocardia sp. CNY236]
MTPPLPSKDLLLEACAGTVHLPHPVLVAAHELTLLHHARRAAEPPRIDDIDCARAGWVRDIDRWVATTMPPPLGAAAMHSETMGMVVDRLVQFCVHAFATLRVDTPACELHFAWKRLAELSLVYTDLAAEITARTRRLPDLTAPRPDERRADGGGDHDR